MYNQIINLTTAGFEPTTIMPPWPRRDTLNRKPGVLLSHFVDLYYDCKINSLRAIHHFGHSPR